MYFLSSPTPSRASRRRARALRSLQVTVVLAFALFISVANATAQEEPVDPNAPVDPAPQVVEAPAEEPPAEEPAPEEPAPEEPAPEEPAEEPAPEEPAPPAEETQQDPGSAPPVDEHVDHGTTPPVNDPEPHERSVPQEITARAQATTYCHQENGTLWTEGHGNIGAAHRYLHSYDIIPNVKNWGNFVRSGKVYNGAAVFNAGCSAAAGFIANTNELLGGDLTYCHANVVWNGGWQVTGYETRTGDLDEVRDHDFWHGFDVIPAYSYYNGFGNRIDVDASGDQQVLAWGCSASAPVVDVCDNLTGDQDSVPGGYVVNGDGDCVPAAVSCFDDQDPLDDGSTTDSIAGDGVVDACADHADATCESDQTATDSSGGPAKETCVDDPDATCVHYDQHPEDLTGGPSKETCVDNADVTCLFDEEAYDAGGSPTSLDACRGVPVACGVGVPVDTNSNANPDLCAVVVPQFKCRVRGDDGTSTLHWAYVTNSPVGFTEANSILIGGSTGDVAPTSFGASGEWTSILQGDTTNAAWMIHSSTAIGSHDAAFACFPDQCPNIEPGDQETVPAGMVHNGGGDCVPEPPTCLFDEVGQDNGKPKNTGRIKGDGVVDRCKPKKNFLKNGCPEADEVATDTNHNGALDTCVPTDIVSAATCQSDEIPTDTNNNGALDTCVPGPDVNCGWGVGVDTNNNVTLDTCVKITPIIDCGVYNDDGSRTLRWRWRNSSGHAVTIPIGLKNAFIFVTQPTSFPAGEGSFETKVYNSAFLRTQIWAVTGNLAVGSYFRQITPRCFPDACPNLAGDQDGVPSGMAINDAGRCVEETTSCTDFDFAPGDTDDDGVNDDCVPVPLGSCGTAVAVDTNDNGNTDTCVRVSPVLECVVNNADGSSTAYFGYNNVNAVAVSVPVGSKNKFSGVAFTGQPTSFDTGRHEQVFAVEIPEAAGNVVWTLTGKTSTANHGSSACYEDSCPNLAGDQQDMPAMMQRNDNGDCVPEPPSCDYHETLTDTDSDGVADTCAPVSCDADQTARDSGTNGVVDTCDPKPLECPDGTQPQDLVPASAPNGVLDTCVSTAAPADSASGGDTGSGDTGSGDDGSAGSGDSEPDASDAETGDGESEVPVDAEGDDESDGETLVAGDAEGSGDDIPFTGAALSVLALIGVGSLVAGSLLRRGARRERHARSRA